MSSAEKPHYRNRLQAVVFLLSLASIVGLLGWLGQQYTAKLDLTAGNRHSLSVASKAVIATLQEPLTITAFTSQNKPLRQQLNALLQPYLDASSLIEFQFTDPDRHPAQLRTLGIKADGELLLQYQSRSRQLRDLNEYSISQAILQLQRSTVPQLIFLSGHGERSPNRGANHDLSDFAATLLDQAFELQTVLPAAGDPLPKNSILIISQPSVELLPADRTAIEEFIDTGGNLLWLIEPDHTIKSLGWLSARLGINPSQGRIIDPNAEQLKAPADFVIARPEEYGSHDTTQALQLTTVFPEACALKVDDDSGWRSNTLITATQHSWVESDPSTAPAKFNPGQDQPGPHTLGIALERDTQRIAVFCDGDFLSNRYLGNGGNRQLGLNLLNWLSSDEQFLDIPPYQAADAQLELSPRQSLFIAFGFLFALPILFLLIAALLWWRRRRAQ